MTETKYQPLNSHPLELYDVIEVTDNIVFVIPSAVFTNAICEVFDLVSFGWEMLYHPTDDFWYEVVWNSNMDWEDYKSPLERRETSD